METKRTLSEIAEEQKKVERAQKNAIRKAHRCRERMYELIDEAELIESAGIGERTLVEVYEEKGKVARALEAAHKKIDRCEERLFELEAEAKEAER